MDNTSLVTLPEIGYYPQINRGGLSMRGKVKVYYEKGRKKARIYIDCRPVVKNKIYCDEMGFPFWSKEHADRVLSVIRHEIDMQERHGVKFDSSKYCRKDQEKLKFDYRYNIFLVEKENLVGKSYLRKLREYGRNYYSKTLGDFDVRLIRTIDIKDFAKTIDKSQKYKKNIIDALEHFFNCLKEDDIIKRVPKFPKVQVKKCPPVWVSAVDQEKILSFIPVVHQPIFRLTTIYGLRIGEARALQWRDIDFRDGVITIQRTFSESILKESTKTDRQNTLPLLPEAEKILTEIKPDFHAADSFVFVSRKRYPYSETGLKRIWHPARKEAGFPKLTLHQFGRHSWASQRVNDGVSLSQIGAVLNHSDIRTTQKYAHVNMEGKMSALVKTKVADLIKFKEG